MDPTEIFRIISQYPTSLIYIILFIFAFVENVFPPSPGDTFVIIGAVLAGKGIIDPIAVFVVTGIGSLASIMLIYHLARIKGRSYFEIHKPFAITAKKLRRVDSSFARHGEKIIILSRFLVGVRTVVIIMAGLARVRPKKMILFSCIGVCFWHSILIAGGYTLAQNLQKIFDFFALYNKVVLAALLVVVTAFLVRKFNKSFGQF